MKEIYQPTIDEKIRLRTKPNQFKVSGDGVFFSLQGEGQSIGKPAVFLRLHFCNLQCSWCDTKYTWDRNIPQFWQEAQDWTVEKALQEISQYPAKRLVVTGGEPLLQQDKLSELVRLIPDWAVEIETNGTIQPDPTLATRCQFNVSPKLRNSGNKDLSRYHSDVLGGFNALTDTTFKFVVQKAGDLEEIEQIVKECDLDANKIIIMPEGATQEAITRNVLPVVEQVINRGWRLLPRLHVMLWGTKRGV